MADKYNLNQLRGAYGAGYYAGKKAEEAELTRLEKLIVLRLIEATHKIAKINYLAQEPIILKEGSK